MKGYFLTRTIQARNGTTIYAAIKGFAEESTVKAEAKAMNDKFVELLDAQVVFMSPTGPVPVMRVRDLMGWLGIEHVGHGHIGDELHEAALVVPINSGIILPGSA